MKTTFTLGDVSEALACDERTVREYLREVGADLDVRGEDPDQVVKRGTVIELCAAHAEEDIGRRLIRLLGRTGNSGKANSAAE
jgi:hypothetical protein